MNAIDLIKVFGVFAIFLIFLIDSLAADLSPIVATKTGPIQGALVQYEAGKQDVYQFTGIPFAEPPTGPRRFKKPVPKTRWTNVFQATNMTKSCIQLLSSTDPDDSVPATPESEDCLYLNIWVPKNTLDSVGSPCKKLPVYVFIHGGAFISGNSMQNTYNGTIFAGINNVIFASIQYRLGSLGFAYLGKNSDAPGNAGLWDQLEALKWVSENIGAFGGNSSEITIGGESAGAASVSFHLLSPYSRKYFQRAIIESGTALGPWAIRTPDLGVTITNAVVGAAATENCPSVNAQSAVADKLSCLRSISTANITSADAVAAMTVYGFPHGPVIDGDFIPKDPTQMLGSGDFYKAPLLIGANQDEGTMFLMANEELSNILMPALDPETYFNSTLVSEAIALGLTALSNWGYPHPIDPTVARAVHLQYWPNAAGNDISNGPSVVQAVSQEMGDYSLVCPTYNWANMVSKAAQDVPLYVYHFSQRPAESALPEWMGVIHTQELSYVFGEPFAEYAQSDNYSRDDQDFSNVMMEYWGNFVKYGTPNAPDRSSDSKLRTWPPYVGTSCKNQIVELSATAQLSSCDDPVKPCGFKARNCMFWSDFFPKVMRVASEKPT